MLVFSLNLNTENIFLIELYLHIYYFYFVFPADIKPLFQVEQNIPLGVFQLRVEKQKQLNNH